MNEHKGAMDFVRASRTGYIAIELGVMVKEKKITRDENDAMMAELMSWDKGGSEPAWVAELFGLEKQ